MHKSSIQSHKFKIEERRRQVASLLAKSMSETDIAIELDVDQSTISRDVKFLKKLCQNFVFDLAKSDLAYYYRQCIVGIEEANKNAWNLFYNGKLSDKEKLLALKLVKECNEAKFSLLTDGPSVLAVKNLEDRLNKIETREAD